MPKTHQATVVAVANQKGGVGKSTIAHLLAVSLARLGYDVGLVDLDSQGHQAALLGIFDDDGLPRDSVYNLFNGGNALSQSLAVLNEKYCEIPLPDDIKNMMTGRYILEEMTSFYFLSGYQQTATISPTDTSELRTLLQPLIDRCEFIILDTGPTTSNLNASALAAADYLLIPMKIGVLSFMGLRDLLHIRTNLINEGLVKRAEIAGLIPTMVRTNTILYQELIAELKGEYGDLVWDDCAIPESVVWEEAAAYQTTVLEHAPNHAAATHAWNLIDRFVRTFAQRKETTVG